MRKPLLLPKNSNSNNKLNFLEKVALYKINMRLYFHSIKSCVKTLYNIKVQVNKVLYDSHIL